MISSRLEAEAVRSDGGKFYAELTVTKVIVEGKIAFTVNVRDITARMRAEEDVLRLAAIVESSQDAIYGVGLDGRILSWNKGAELIYGYTGAEVLGRNVSLLVPAGGREELTKIAESVLEGRQTRNVGTVRAANGGRLVHVSLTVSPILDSQGRVTGASAIARDITAQKAAEEALRKATETSVYASPIPIVAVDTDNHVTMWNLAAEDVFGWKEQEIVGKANPIIPEDAAGVTGALYRELFAGKTVRGVEVRRRNRDGALAVISLSAAPLWDREGNVSGIIKFLTDITAQKRTEEALRAAEEKYRSIFENSLDGIYQVAPDGRYLSANLALARMLGFDSAEELIQTRQHVANGAEFGRRLEKDGTVKNFEYHLDRKDGTVIWLSENARVVRDADGRITHYEGSAKDVTQQRELEQQLRQMQKIEAIGTLAGGVAHDFNNILMAVSSFAELLDKKLPDDDPRRSYIGEIVKATDRGASLTQGLLAFSRKQVFQPQALDLNALVRDQIDMMKRLIRENIDMRFMPGEKLRAIKADPSQILQVMMNLVINARDAMPDGGELIIETTNAESDLAQREPESPATSQCVVLSVRDSGCGMSAETKSHIFEPFFTTKEQGKGTGLGLATVFGIVRQSGGHIVVETEPGVGSIFKVYLPSVDETTWSSERDLVQTGGCGTETILLAEDEESVRQATQEYLVERGYTVLVATRGAEALELVQRHRYPIHLLLTDLMMPKMSGVELAERFTRLCPHAKVIFISGYSEDLFSGRLKVGPEHILLRKPFPLAVLGRAVRKALDKKAVVAAGI